METNHILYEIIIEGHLDRYWSEWLDNLTITFPTARTTLLRGRLADQTALFGVLKKLHNLGLSLISVRRIEDKQEGE
ncbi:MAG: hypothetical protein K8L97_27070 [Anaerolineae bacterium]|nr:hypothetical protein [Anaerolineae bacterium]